MIKRQIIECDSWFGGYNIKVTNHLTGEVKEDFIKNQITNTALDAIINILDNIDPNLDIKYLAVGTDGTALDPDDTTLGTEIFRASFDTSNKTATGEFTTTFTIFDSEAVGSWKEIGIFCGDSATSTADTGIMLSRILYSRDKTNSEQIDFTRIDRVERA